MRPIQYPRAKVASASMAILAHGNSLTAGVGASSSANYWPAQMALVAPVLGSGITPNNQGVGGQSISVDAGAGTMASTAASAIDANLAAGKINVLIALEYTNELKPNGNNAAAAHAAMKAYCLARKAAATSAGKQLRIIVGTCPPAGADPLVNGATAKARIDARNSAIIAANALTRAQYRDYADVLWDLAMEEPFKTIFANGVFTNAVFQAAGIWAMSDGSPDDYTHFGDSGYQLMGQSAARAIARVRR